ncbi:hypothetical protein [Agrobacterium tumefaciens]|uniref:hypothetical protein n=1 Tax=Agrobacterium tumefaciens TaxID=358 RepID=UPI001573F7F4|nr:hypothetical protein [Agrobacterium tumefaciens]
MVDAVAVNVPQIADIPAGTLPDTLGAIYGKAVYAADNVGAALYKAEQAQAKADTIEGQAQYAADTAGATAGTVDNYVAPLVGKMNSEMDQVFAALNLTRS